MQYAALSKRTGRFCVSGDITERGKLTIAIVNGSARHGNAEAAINGFVKGIDGKHKTEIIVADKLNISGCKG